MTVILCLCSSSHYNVIAGQPALLFYVRRFTIPSTWCASRVSNVYKIQAHTSTVTASVHIIARFRAFYASSYRPSVRSRTGCQPSPPSVSLLLIFRTPCLPSPWKSNSLTSDHDG